jgi:serine protease
VAPYLQQLFKGLGTGGELWSGVMTQYCQGVATGTETWCAWSEGPGAPAANLSLTTGTFAMQSTWGNDGAGGGDCEFSHAIVSNGGGGNTVTVTNPGS